MRDSKEAALETVLDETGSCILTADTLSSDQRSRRAGPWSILPMDGIIRSILNVSLLEYSMFRLNGTTDNAAWKAHFGR